MFKRIKQYFAARREMKQAAELDKRIHSPMLFTPKQRAYLKSLFPDSWCHQENLSQIEIFRIAFACTAFGFPCFDIMSMKFCMYVLHEQKIYINEKGMPQVIKRAP